MAANSTINLRTIRGLEFALLFLALPCILAALAQFWQPLVYSVFLIICAFAGWVLFNDPSFDRTELTCLHGSRKGLGIALFRFGILLAVTVIASHIFTDTPGTSISPLGIQLALGYALLSALPQEFLFRTFLFHRYRMLVATPWQLNLLSAVPFALAHLLFQNWMAVAGSFVGGLVFADSYGRTQSLPFVALEHSLWGYLLFSSVFGASFSGAFLPR